ENPIYTAVSNSVEVNSKGMDSTLSRAPRAIKKTSQRVTRAYSFSKIPKTALWRALMSHSATEGGSPSSADESSVGSQLTSSSLLA
ncbi:ECT2 protein, partial [Eubucco bourcierii]|nr:ECT2 protein [Eubucco bourcierii]